VNLRNTASASMLSWPDPSFARQLLYVSYAKGPASFA
jgi:hypothetical protein